MKKKGYDIVGQGYATEMVMAMIDFAYSLGIRDFQGTDIEYQSTIFRLHLD